MDRLTDDRYLWGVSKISSLLSTQRNLTHETRATSHLSCPKVFVKKDTSSSLQGKPEGKPEQVAGKASKNVLKNGFDGHDEVALENEEGAESDADVGQEYEADEGRC